MAYVLGMVTGGSARPVINIRHVESKVTVYNGDPGVKNLDVIVNGQRFKIAGLGDKETVTLDVSSAMVKGARNTITLKVYGKPGASPPRLRETYPCELPE